jgi:paraquat-inducible protein B
MSKPVNPMAIGGFLLGGLALLILALLVFGGGQFFKPKINWVVYFDTSLNGLNLGAPVKVQGVQVGIVKEIQLQLDRNQQRLMKPVVLEIEPWRLASPDGTPLELSLLSGDMRQEEFQRLIAAGLRARLEVQSLLTGLLYVDLDFHPHQALRLTGLKYRDLPEVPSVPPTVDEMITTLEDVVKKIRSMPLDAMVGDVSMTLADIRKLVGSDETRKSQAALTQALVKAQSIMEKLDRQLPTLTKNFDQTLDHLGQASRDISVTAGAATSAVRGIHELSAPVLRTAEQTLVKASDALETTRAAAGNVAEATASDSRLQDAVIELRRSAQSLRQLTDYLERHPDSILFGKQD